MRDPSQLVFLNKDDVHALLPYSACIPLMREAFEAVSRKQAVQPIRTAMRLPDQSGLLGMMPGYVESNGTLGIKIVSVFPGNFGTEHRSHQGLVILYDHQNGCPKAILDGGAITAIRTASASAVATSLLARPESRTVLILGYGEQAEAHLMALSTQNPAFDFQVWGRSNSKAEQFAQAQSERLSIPVRACTNLQSACEQADIICTTTAAKDPILLGEWLRPGTHLNIVGSSTPNERELDHEAVQKAKFFCDYEASLRELGGEFRAAIDAGAITHEHLLGEIGDVLIGECPGRETDRDITMFKSLGMISQDLLASQHILDRALLLEGGQTIRL